MTVGRDEVSSAAPRRGPNAGALARILGLSAALVACSCEPPQALPPTAPAAGPAPHSAKSAPKRPWLNQLVALAPSKTGTLPVRGLPMVVLTTHELRLLGADAYALPLPPRADWSRGFPASQKQGGAQGLFLQRFGRWLSQTRAPGGKDIDLMIDREIPYRMFIEVLYTGGRSGYQRFHLIVRDQGEPAQIVVRLPKSATPERVSMALTIVGAGVAIQLSDGSVAPGCAALGPGVSIPPRGGQLDEPALESCLARWAHKRPELRAVRIAAEPAAPFGQIVQVLDAVRGVPQLADLEFRLPVGARPSP